MLFKSSLKDLEEIYLEFKEFSNRFKVSFLRTEAFNNLLFIQVALLAFTVYWKLFLISYLERFSALAAS